jgi:hypothetical protein
MLTGRRLAFALVFAGLVAMTVGTSCQGFFVQPTLTSITINPTAPSVQLGQTTTVQAYGVNSDGQGSYLTSGVSWSSSDDTTATVTGTGSAVLSGVAIGTVTLTASAQSVTNTATATVFITISSLAITPQSQSMAASATTPEPFIVKANGTTDISSSAVLTVYQNGVAQSTITCAYSSAAPAGQYCTSVAATVGQYQVVATYTGSTLTATATLNITN